MFNANDYSTRELIEMEMSIVPESEEKQDAIALAIQLVEDGAYFVAEAVAEAIAEMILSIESSRGVAA